MAAFDLDPKCVLQVLFFRARGIVDLGEELLDSLDVFMRFPHKDAALDRLDTSELAEIATTVTKIAATIEIVKVQEARSVVALDQRWTSGKPRAI